MLLISDFKPVAKAWASFVVQTLEGTSCTSKIPFVEGIWKYFAIFVGCIEENNTDVQHKSG